MTFEEMLACSPEGLQEFYSDYEIPYRSVPGSGHNHQNWSGGYRDHIAECGTIAAALYESLSAIRSLPFTLYDALTVLLLHDIEKIKRYGVIDEWMGLAQIDGEAFKDAVIWRYDIILSADQQNALKYIHGEPDNEHRKDARVMGRLAAFVHSCDILSARLWFDEPSDR